MKRLLVDDRAVPALDGLADLVHPLRSLAGRPCPVTKGHTMTLQILVPLHTYPDGNSVNIAAHVGAVAGHLKADVHGLVLNATFPPATSLM